MNRPTAFQVIVLLFSLSLIFGTGISVADEFPQFDCIQPNVTFWVNVYTQYTTSQGILHDSHHLDIIYDIIPLQPYDAPGSRKINRGLIKKASAKYTLILKRLARNPNAGDEEFKRIAALFGETSTPEDFLKAAENIRCQIGQKDRFEAGLKRSGAYIDQMRAVFRSYDLPEDLAYLPHVESSFNPNAYSKFGAAGVWQFTRSTGKQYMKVDYVLDERRDPLQATYAAAQLLRDNYAKLGSWPLAITAYNHGATGMERAKNLHGDYPSVFSDYRSRIFKFASRNFYSEFLAAKLVAGNYRDYFGDLPLDQPTNLHTVKLNGYIAFEDLCRYLDMDKQMLKELNPALRSPVISGQKLIPEGYALRLPGPDDEYHSVIAQLPASLYQNDQKPSRFYTVQQGDTAGKVAKIHGVKLNDLMLANNLNQRATIYPHQTLRVPLPGEPVTPQPRQPVEQQTVSLLAKAEIQETKTAEATEETPAPRHYPKPVLASVIPMPMQEPPQKTVENAAAEPDPEHANLEVVTADVHIEKAYDREGQPLAVIRVEIEETLGHYAEWANVRAGDIRRLNDLKFGQLLHLNQKVKIPLNNTDAQAFEQLRYEYHKRLQEDFFAVYRISDLQPYRVHRGDNYWTLCQDKFGIPMWLLKHCNPETDLTALRVQQKVMVPTVDKITADEPGLGDDDSPDDTGMPQLEEDVSTKNS